MSPCQLVGLARGTIRKLLDKCREVVVEDVNSHPKLKGLVEVDETAIGARKYNRGKRNRQGVGWHGFKQRVKSPEEPTGKRRATQITAHLVDRRTESILTANLRNDVFAHSKRWMEGLLQFIARFPLPPIVNHDKAFVDYGPGGCLVHTNTIESVHSSLKRTARRMNLFENQRISI